MASLVDDRAPLLAEEGGVRQRGASKPDPKSKEKKRWTPPMASDWDPNLPYGGKVFLARKKKPDPVYVTVVEVNAGLTGWELCRN